MTSESYTRGAKVLVFIACALGWAFDAVGLTIINFLTDDLIAAFGVTEAEIGFVFSAQYIATVPGAILFGTLLLALMVFMLPLAAFLKAAFGPYDFLPSAVIT